MLKTRQKPLEVARAAMAVLAGCCLLPSGAIAVETIQIPSYSGSAFRVGYPAIADGKVAWYAHPTRDYLTPNYYVYDIATGQTAQITSYAENGNFRVSFPATADGKVAWYAHPASSTLAPNYYVYDTATGQTTQITSYSGVNFQVSAPSIGEGKVVWYAHPTSTTLTPNYYLYDTATGQTTQITSYSPGGSFRVGKPAISNGKVAWYANPTSSTQAPNYFVYDIATRQTTQITSYSGVNFQVGDASISNGKLAWYAHPTSILLIPNYFVYDIASGQTTQITSYSGGGNFRLGNPSVGEGKVAWYAHPDSSTQVPNYYVYDIATRQTTQITSYYTSTAFAVSDPSVSDGEVAWYAHPTSIVQAPNYYIAFFNQRPTGISLSSSTVPENQPAGTSVGTLSTTDDSGAFTYALVSGAGSADNAAFTISGAALLTTAPFDYEAKNTYRIRIRTTDSGGRWYEAALTITVQNVNEAPTGATLSNMALSENQPVGTAVGTFATTDPDSGNAFTYTLVGGAGSTDNASFTISGNMLVALASFNFEANSSYSVRVRTTDQDGLWNEAIFVIVVDDIAEAPFDLRGFSLNLANRFTIHWTCEAGYSYQVQCSETLQAEDWQAVGPGQSSTNGATTMTYTDNSESCGSRKFYRVLRTATE